MKLDRNADITKDGWKAILKLVCDGSSIGCLSMSNHTLYDVDMLDHDVEQERIRHALGIDNFNLLKASLEINSKDLSFRNGKAMAVRMKVLWSHANARADLNIGTESFIPDSAMPYILAWIGDDSNEDNASLIQYHEPHLPVARISRIRFDAIFRIIKARPGLCS